METADPRPTPVLFASPYTRLLEAVALVCVLATVVSTIYYWGLVPDTIPSHFGLSGEPDAWGSRALLLILPALSVLLYAGMSIAQRYPERFNYPWPLTDENTGAQFRLARRLVLELKAITIATFGWIQWSMIQTALGHAEGLSSAVLLLAGLALIAAVAVYFVRASRAR